MAEKQKEKSWYRRSPEEALDALDTRREGLGSGDVESRLSEYGANTIRTEQKVGAWVVLLHQFTSPLVYVLLAAPVVTLFIRRTQQLLHLQPLPWSIWIASIAVAATAIIVNELHKRLRPRDKVNSPESWISRVWDLTSQYQPSRG